MKNKEELLCERCCNGSQSFFSKLDETDLCFINENKSLLTFKKGETIFSEGSKPQGVYCLSDGIVKVSKHSNDGREQIIRIVFPSEFIGLRAILSGHFYTVSALALEDCVVCFIKRTDFFQLMLKYPDCTNSLIIILSKLLEEAESRMVSLSHKPVRQRLAETLLFLNHSFNAAAPAYPKPYLNITRSDLANIIGTAPETVIRLLSEFREARIIETKGRKIYLSDISRLQFTASQYD